MRLKGISLEFMDCEPEAAGDFNRWYDLDHVPESMALPEFLGARRYVATADLKAARGPQELPAFQNGGSSYLACYWLGVDDIPAAGAAMKPVADGLLKQRRTFKKARVTYWDRCRLVRTYIGRNVPPLTEDAVPYVGHTGLLIAISETIDKARRSEMEQWWDQVHMPDVANVPGFVAILRFESVIPEKDGLITRLYLTEGDPVLALRNIGEGTRTGAVRRSPFEKPPYRIVFNGLYQMIQPLRYEFLK